MKTMVRGKKKTRNRLDILLLERKIATSRQRARALIMAGRVLVDDHPVSKAGASIATDADITVKGGDLPFVSRGGMKLRAALEHFAVDVDERVCLDVGASTGGFTDCLLQHGARKVYAVDVGYGQLAWKLRQDPRVVTCERCNIRHATAAHIPEGIDLATIDVSFISLRIVVPAVMSFLKPDARLIMLVKPQFEAGRDKVGKGGIVRNAAVHREVIAVLRERFEAAGLEVRGVIPSPLLGAKGNREFLLYALRTNDSF